MKRNGFAIVMVLAVIILVGAAMGVFAHCAKTMVTQANGVYAAAKERNLEQSREALAQLRASRGQN